MFNIGDRVYYDGGDAAVFHGPGYGTVVDRKTAMGGLYAQASPGCTVVDFDSFLDDEGQIQEIMDHHLSVPE